MDVSTNVPIRSYGIGKGGRNQKDRRKVRAKGSTKQEKIRHKAQSAPKGSEHESERQNDPRAKCKGRNRQCHSIARGGTRSNVIQKKQGDVREV